MVQASTNYNALKTAGQWNKATPEWEKLISLETQLEQLRTQIKTDKPTKVTNQKLGKECKKPKWIHTPPTQDESEPKRFNKKTYYWCANHKC
jgi:hypothetical protein